MSAPAISPAKPRLAFKDEVVTCEKGHKLYVVARNMAPGDAMRPQDLKRISKRAQKPVRKGQTIRQNCDCGACWIRQNPKGAGAQIHFSDGGWRPE